MLSSSQDHSQLGMACRARLQLTCQAVAAARRLSNQDMKLGHCMKVLKNCKHAACSHDRHQTNYIDLLVAQAPLHSIVVGICAAVTSSGLVEISVKQLNKKKHV